MNEESLFIEAMEIQDAAERVGYLDRACAGNAALRARLERLLDEHRRAGSFLGQPVVARHATRAFDPAPVAETAALPVEHVATQIGPYKILQQIGEGGMGTVYMAEQIHPVQRKVALKVIKAGLDGRQVIARFEAERQALAMMDHVNIARVFEAGATEAGRPYFVMELVHGVPITRYCDDNHLTPRARLDLFVPVCQAIQHAHQKGIIHRDIKPSNVMVTLYDGKPVPKVIDFGVAKATEQKLTERTLFTQYGTLVGTLEYMSPEQAEMSALGVDTRSDIYSLGVLLYELLTGNTPLTHKRMKEGVYAEILRMIKEEEPPKPSTRLSDSGEALASISAQRHMEPAKLSKLMRGELDWIVMKTLEKDRNRRYETAKDFAADVQRYLADESVQACPPSAMYRFRKFAIRNKRALASAAVLAVAVLVVTGTLGWAVRDREAHAQEAARERAARQTALELEVSLALKEAEQSQEQGKWPEALSAARRAEGLLAGGGSDELRERVHLLRKDLEMVLRLEEIRLLSSETKDNEFDWDNADRTYAQAFADYGIDVLGLPVEEAAARIRARVGVAVPLAAALDDWANARDAKDKAGRLALAALAQAADPDPWRWQVREAVKKKDTKALVALAASSEILRQPPTSLLVLVRALSAGDLAEAVIAVLRDAQRQFPGDFWINYVLGANLRKMGPPYRDEAVSFSRAALAVRPQSLAAHNILGVALKDQGKLDEAIACYRKAIELDPKFATVHINLGTALMDQKKLDEAIACYRKAIELDPKSAMAHNNLGIALKHQKKLDEAIAAYRKAIEIDPKSAGAYSNLGGLLCDDLKEYDKAIECFRKAIDLDPNIANYHFCLGNALRNQQKLPEAVLAYRKATELDPNYAMAWQVLGWLQYRIGDWRASIEALEKSCKLQPGGTGDGGQWIVLALAHAKLAAQDGLPEKVREDHKIEARRRYEQADKQIDTWWRARPGDVGGQAIWDFRAEARELMGTKESKK
jgi:serine/threonine protein kinase/Tfp pilus assembly protein PilF